MMNQKFEELSAAALTAADSTLAHIAEREQLTMQQNARIAARTLEKAGLAQKAQKPVQHKKRLRMFAAVAAAAVMLAGTAIGISAYVGHNKDVTQSRFGAGCETTFEALTMQEAVSVSNGRNRVTLEGCVNDGIRQMILVSYASENAETPLDLDKIEMARFWYADGKPFWGWQGAAFEFAGEREQQDGWKADKIYWAYYLQYDESLEGQTLTMSFPKWEYEGIVKDALTDIEIPVLMQKNTDAAVYTAENGDSIRLSGFELSYTVENEKDPISMKQLALIMEDGSRHQAAAGYDAADVDNPCNRFAEIYAEKNAGDCAELEHPRFHDGKEYMGWFDTEQIAAVEIDGVTYTRAK